MLVRNKRTYLRFVIATRRRPPFQVSEMHAPVGSIVDASKSR